MSEEIKSKSPMMPGTTIGQIDTTMNSCNVDRGKTPGVHQYKDMPSAKGGGSSIVGPGAQAKWDTQTKIKGNNLKY